MSRTTMIVARGGGRPAASVVLFLASWLEVAVAVAAPGRGSAPTRGDAIDAPIVLSVAADRDDDDADGVADGEQKIVSGRAADDVVPFAAGFRGISRIEISKGATSARLLSSGKPIAWSDAHGGVELQGLTPGDVEGAIYRGARRTPFVVHVRAYGFRGGAGEDVDPARLHASMERTAPAAAPSDPAADYDDPDALRVHLSGDEALPPRVAVQSYGAVGNLLDRLEPLVMKSVACRPGEGKYCWSSAPLRLVVDDTDRLQPLVLGRSLRGEVGGALVVERLDDDDVPTGSLRREGRGEDRAARTREGRGAKAQAIRIEGPRATPAGPLGRYRVRLRPFAFRISPGGAPPFGITDERAAGIVRSELSLAAATWGQCGVALGPLADVPVKVVDPPSASLLSLGDDAGLPTSGGRLRLRVDGKSVELRIAAGLPVRAVADQVAAALEAARVRVTVSPNARIGPGAAGSVDLLVRRLSGAFALLESAADGHPLSTDSSLAVRIGTVDLADGLHHFGDVDAVAGTLEERALVKAIDDGDPTTLDLIFVPFFGGGGRIGESFIGSDASSVENVVVLDRAGVRARRSSFTLAHEMGHVLLDIPGHPDDYGTDTPSSLMDSDAADASAYGPRRLSLDECARMLRQSGPASRVPLLTPWKLEPMRYGSSKGASRAARRPKP